MRGQPSRESQVRRCPGILFCHGPGVQNTLFRHAKRRAAPSQAEQRRSVILIANRPSPGPAYQNSLHSHLFRWFRSAHTHLTHPTHHPPTFPSNIPATLTADGAAALRFSVGGRTLGRPPAFTHCWNRRLGTKNLRCAAVRLSESVSVADRRCRSRRSGGLLSPMEERPPQRAVPTVACWRPHRCIKPPPPPRPTRPPPRSSTLFTTAGRGVSHTDANSHKRRHTQQTHTQQT
jgi:hypothetical protein